MKLINALILLANIFVGPQVFGQRSDFIVDASQGRYYLDGFLTVNNPLVPNPDVNPDAAHLWQVVTPISKLINRPHIRRIVLDNVRSIHRERGTQMQIAFWQQEISLNPDTEYLGIYGEKISITPELRNLGYEDRVIDRFTEQCFEKLQQARKKYKKQFFAGDCGEVNINGFRNPGQVAIESQLRIILYKSDFSHISFSMKPYKKLQGHIGDVLVVKLFGPSMAMAAGSEGRVTSWHLPTGQPVWQKDVWDPIPGSRGDERPILALDICESIDSVVLAGDYGFLQIRRLSNGELIRSLSIPSADELHNIAAVFSQDCDYVYVAAQKQIFYDNGYNIHENSLFRARHLEESKVKISVYDVEFGPVNQWEFVDSQIVSLGMTNNPEEIMVTSRSQVQIYNIARDRFVFSLNVSAVDPTIRNAVILGANLTANRDYVAVSTLSGVSIIDVETNDPIQARYLTNQISQIGTPFFTSDDRMVGVATAFGDYILWDVLTKKRTEYSSQVSELGTRGVAELPIRFDPDLKYMIQPYAARRMSGISSYGPPKFGESHDLSAYNLDAENGLEIYSIEFSDTDTTTPQ